MTTTASHLRCARNILADWGWTQGRWRNWRGLCILGAIRAVTPRRDRKAVRRVLAEAIWPERQLLPYFSLLEWNDRKCRTKDEVLAAFTRAILHEEAKAAALAPVVATPDRVGVA